MPAEIEYKLKKITFLSLDSNNIGVRIKHFVRKNSLCTEIESDHLFHSLSNTFPIPYLEEF